MANSLSSRNGRPWFKILALNNLKFTAVVKCKILALQRLIEESCVQNFGIKYIILKNKFTEISV